MQSKTLILIAVAAALVAACNRTPQSKQPAPSTGASQTQSSAPTTSDTGTPSAAEKRDGANPTQGQVDPKEPAQHKDFQQKGDAQGPTSADTTPKK